jgi:hypothetical protein
MSCRDARGQAPVRLAGLSGASEPAPVLHHPARAGGLIACASRGTRLRVPPPSGALLPLAAAHTVRSAADRSRHSCWAQRGRRRQLRPAGRRRPLGSGPAAGAGAGQRGGSNATLALLDRSAAIDAREAARRPPSTSRGGAPAAAGVRHRRLRGRAVASGRPGLRQCAFACGRRRVSVKDPRVSSQRSYGSSERPIPSM